MPSLFPFHFATTTESETALKLSEDRRAADNAARVHAVGNRETTPV